MRFIAILPYSSKRKQTTSGLAHVSGCVAKVGASQALLTTTLLKAACQYAISPISSSYDMGLFHYIGNASALPI